MMMDMGAPRLQRPPVRNALYPLAQAKALAPLGFHEATRAGRPQLGIGAMVPVSGTLLAAAVGSPLVATSGVFWSGV